MSARLALCLILQEVGGPIDPGYGIGGDPVRPIKPPGGSTLPIWNPAHPDHSLPVPPGVTPPAAPGGALKDKLVVLWHVPGQTEWHGKVIEPGHPDAGLPEGAQPKA